MKLPSSVVRRFVKSYARKEMGRFMCIFELGALL